MKNVIKRRNSISQPVMILEYNKDKNGTDFMDSRIEDFRCKWKTRRYPPVFFMHILDVSLLITELCCQHGNEWMHKIKICKIRATGCRKHSIQLRYQRAKIFAHSKSAFNLFGLRPAKTTNDMNTSLVHCLMFIVCSLYDYIKRHVILTTFISYMQVRCFDNYCLFNE